MPQALGHARDGSTFPIHSRACGLPAHDAGTAVTVETMMQKATGPEGAEHPQVRDFALAATAQCADRDDWGQAQAIYRAVKNQIRYRGEYGQTAQTPLLTLKWGAGNCVQSATLVAALLQSIGIPVRIQTVALPGRRDFGHVFAVAGIRQHGRVAQWRALDTTVPRTAAGWTPPDVSRRKFWGDNRLGSTGGTLMQQGNEMGFLGLGKVFHVVSGAVKGFATGGPAGAVAGGAKATIGEIAKAKAKKAARKARFQQMQRQPHMSGYFDGGLPMRRYPPTPAAPLLSRDPTWHGNGGRVYLGDAGGVTDFVNHLTPTQKLVGGVVVVGALLAVTQ